MDILNKIKQNVLKIEPEAEIYLFGSRARGDYNEESDWDLLVLLPGETNYRRESIIISSLFKIELHDNIGLSTLIKSKDFWYNNKIYHETPFYKNVVSEKIAL